MAVFFCVCTMCGHRKMSQALCVCRLYLLAEVITQLWFYWVMHGVHKSWSSSDNWTHFGCCLSCFLKRPNSCLSIGGGANFFGVEEDANIGYKKKTWRTKWSDKWKMQLNQFCETESANHRHENCIKKDLTFKVYLLSFYYWMTFYFYNVNGIAIIWRWNVYLFT